ncbi:protein commissureless 1 [Drosophila ficusphila]|uniref:protein commissureless 1 n=1 Tax=Drosophila ficusphila TaxID=30025 RepID=UPI0007E809BE|nr:protein commissureless 1 [Drosophila ficusphila]
MISTTDYPSVVETTTSSEELYAEYISAPASSMSPAAIAEHLQQNQITFEIPSAHDLRHIDALNSFNALLQRIGNAAVSYDPAPPSGWSPDGSISTEQLSKSVVLDLADLRDRSEDSTDSSWWSQIFGDADMHVIINYLWIGVVSSLVVLSLVFILFSCYFYRKFRTWKKCNKDIRAQIHAASDSYSSHLVGCDASRLLLHQQMQQGQHHRGNEAGFYQIESPPCYTIATGLPSYDEALHHQPRHFACGMKFVYPSLAAVHHHHHHHPAAAACVSNWEKDERQERQEQSSLNKLQKCKLSAAVEEDKAESSSSPSLSSSSSSSSSFTSCNLAAATPAICINMPNGRQDEKQQQQQDEEQDNSAVAVAVAQSLLPAAAADDDCASLVVVVAA